MSATLAYVILFSLCLIYSAFFVYQMRQIIKGREKELEQVIKTLDREKKLEEKIENIKNYEITIESRLNKIQEKLGEE